MRPSTAIFALAPLHCHALLGINWSVGSPPANGLKDVTFPLTLQSVAHATGYYYAMQFGFQNVDGSLTNIGYIGLQPRPDVGKASVIHAAFSSFISGTESSDAHCHTGADSGPGSSCAVEIYSSYTPKFNLTVENTSGTTWQGKLIDTTLGNSTIIGSWTLPPGTGGLKTIAQGGFIEYYLWNDGQAHNCSSLPFTGVIFGVPSTKTVGAGQVTLSDPFEYGPCRGQAGAGAGQYPNGDQYVQVGF